jgi:hypothetical protein
VTGSCGGTILPRYLTYLHSMLARIVDRVISKLFYNSLLSKSIYSNMIFNVFFFFQHNQEIAIYRLTFFALIKLKFF